MFAQDKDFAVCLQDYGPIKKYARVPKVNELYAEVEQWLAEGNEFQPMPDNFEPPKPDDTKVAEAKAYLESTDWIVVKINEAQVQGQDVTVLLNQYSKELAERQVSRDLINQLELEVSQ